MQEKRSVLLLLTGLLLATCLGQSECKKGKSPLDELPAYIRQVTHFGQRADWSHDGKRILFLEKTFGDAYEIDLETNIIRAMTHRYYHEGYVRVLYLANGDILLSGARKFDAQDPVPSRKKYAELWVLKKDLSGPPTSLGVYCYEGPAVSRKKMRIAWTVGGTTPDATFYLADIVYENGKPKLTNKKKILQKPDLNIMKHDIETQNFRPPDEKELIFSAYGDDYKVCEVAGLEIETGKVVNYSKAPDRYDEPEGIFPDGKHTLVECDMHADKGAGDIDIYKLALDGSGKIERLTFFGDYPGYKSSNPVVSDDGRYMAFQYAKKGDWAGVGRGILIFDLALWEEMCRQHKLDSVGARQLPTTHEEAVAHLVGTMSKEDKQKVRSTTKEDLIKFHFGWGMGIRNDFGLWGKNSELLQSCARKKGQEQIHPDAASMLIIEGVWEALQAKSP